MHVSTNRWEGGVVSLSWCSRLYVFHIFSLNCLILKTYSNFWKHIHVHIFIILDKHIGVHMSTLLLLISTFFHGTTCSLLEKAAMLHAHLEEYASQHDLLLLWSKDFSPALQVFMVNLMCPQAAYWCKAMHICLYLCISCFSGIVFACSCIFTANLCSILAKSPTVVTHFLPLQIPDHKHPLFSLNVSHVPCPISHNPMPLFQEPVFAYCPPHLYYTANCPQHPLLSPFIYIQLLHTFFSYFFPPLLVFSP